MVAILVAFTFIGLLVVDALIKKRAAKKAVAVIPDGAISARPAFPLGYFFSPGHVWMNLKPSGSLTVGWDELVQRFLGEDSRILLKKPGDIVSKGEPLAILSKGEAEICVISPVAGRIEESNSKLEEHPEQLAENPYEKGWFYQIEPFQLAEDIAMMKVADQAKSWLADEFHRLKDFIQTNRPQLALANQTLSDGGVLVDGLVDHLDEDSVEKFTEQFLLNSREQM